MAMHLDKLKVEYLTCPASSRTSWWRGAFLLFEWHLGSAPP